MPMMIPTKWARVVLCVWMATGLGYAREHTSVQVRAAAEIRENNLDDSRSRALLEAKKQCIKDVLRSQILDPIKYSEHTQDLQNMFLDNPEPYIGRLAVENEEIIDDGQRYRVTVNADVRANAMSVALLEEGIGDVFTIGPKPTVMVLVRERFETRVSGTRMTETVLIKQLRDKGITVTDPEQKKLVDLRNRLFSQGTGDMDAALQSAMAFKADYLIFGEAVVTSSGTLSGTDLKARYANLSAKVVEASSGRVMATENSQAKTRHVDELTGGNWALEDAASKAGKEILSRFEAILVEEVRSGAPILIDLYGLDYESQAQEAESVLKEIEGVSSLSRRFHFSGVGQFEATFKGTSATFARALKYTEIDGQSLQVIETQPRYLRVKRVGSPKAGPPATDELFKKYLDEKYKRFDMEGARQASTELMAKMGELAQSQEVSDQQRKQLHAARQEIEEKTKQAYYRQQELRKREEELQEAKELQKKTEKRLEAIQKETEESKEEQERLREELETAKQGAYVASNNYANASRNASMSAGDMVNSMNQGVQLAKGINGLFGGGGFGGFGLF